MTCKSPNNLSELSVGDEAVITGYAIGEAAYRSKLLALGLTRNEKFQVVKCAPLGDPIEIEVRGYRLSLRKEEATTILVRRLHEEACDCDCG